MARKVGYTRAIEGAPDLPAQREAVLRAGCTEVYVEHSPANVCPAPQWAAAVGCLGRGDWLVVPSLEQLAFTLEQLAEVLVSLIDRGLQLELCEWQPPCPLDTAALVEIVKRLDAFDRAGRRALVHAGLGVARSKGRVGGRPQKLATEQIEELKRLMAVPGADPVEVGGRFGLSRMSVYRYLKR